MKENYKKRILYDIYFVKVNSHTRSLDLYLTQSSDFAIDSFSKKNVREIYNAIKAKKPIWDCPILHTKNRTYIYGIASYSSDSYLVNIGCTTESLQKFYSIANKVLKLK